MRSSDKVLTIEQYQLTEVQLPVSTEEFIEIRENKLSRQIDVLIAYKDDDGDIIKQEQKTINGTFYELLMSEYPNFALNKPLNEYREQDLWYVIDLMS